MSATRWARRKCDFWPGIASNVEMVATTRPYYRSTYMFVSRASANLKGLTLDDPRLKKLKIGVQMVGNDASNTPPAHALAERGHHHQRPRLHALRRLPPPQSAGSVVEAVEHGDVDVALVWGPLAGYFAAQSPVPLRLEPVTPWFADQQWPMQFDVSVGVQKNDQKLLNAIDRVLVRRKGEIDRLLAAYHVPLVTGA